MANLQLSQTIIYPRTKAKSTPHSVICVINLFDDSVFQIQNAYHNANGSMLDLMHGFLSHCEIDHFNCYWPQEYTVKMVV